jgi:DNA-binding SARP family transcriptional activator
MTVAIRLLGRFAVSIDGTEIDTPWRLRKAKTLVKLLALATGHHVHRDVLIDLLWPDADFAVGANNLHQTLHAARRAIGAHCLVLRDDVVSLTEDVVSVDVDNFEAAAERALSSRRRDDLVKAAGLWTGELLTEDLYEDWAAPHRERLNATRVNVITGLAAALLAEGCADEAVAVLEPIAVERPLDEVVHRALIVALTAAGRRWDAAGAFERLRADLAESYAVEPDPETSAVYRRLFVGTAANATAGPHNLPTSPTSFVGRHRELIELEHLLERTRLLS